MRVFILLLVVFVIGCQSTQVKRVASESIPVKKAPKNQFHLQFNQELPVVFNGKIISRSNAAQAGGGAAYPAYNAGGLLAGILIHAAVQGGVNSSRAKKAQAAADQVLTPYNEAIKNITVDFLMADALSVERTDIDPIVLMPSAKVPADLVAMMPRVQSLPVFSLTQNAMSMILTHTLTFDDELKKAKKKKHYKPLIVQYVFAVPEGNPHAFWTDEEYKNFYATTHSLFGESLRLAMTHKEHAQKLNLAKFKTVKYLEGADKKVERGMVLKSNCDRLVFVTLRGAIKSVPKQAAGECLQAANI